MAQLVKREDAGIEDVYDVADVDEFHNFFANGILVHNCMQVAQKLSGFTPIEANKLRKTLVKEKNPEVLEKLHKKFTEGAKSRVEAGEVTEKQVEEIFELLKSFSKYGFNKSVDEHTKVITDNGLQEIQDIKIGTKVISFDGETFVETEVAALHDHGSLEGFEITFDDGSKVVCSINHKFMTKLGMQPLYNIIEQKLGILGYGVPKKRRLELSKVSTALSDISRNEISSQDSSKSNGSNTNKMLLRDGIFHQITLQNSQRQMSRSNQNSESTSCRSGYREFKESEQVFERASRLEKEMAIGGSNKSCKFARSESYSCSNNGEIKQNCSIQSHSFNNSDKDFGKTRNTTTTCRETGDLAKKQSRKDDNNYKQSNKSSKKKQGRRMVGGESFEQFGVSKISQDTMWRKTKTSRFFERQYDNRSGWMLAFWAGFFNQEKKSQSSQDTSTGYNVDTRSGKTTKYVNKSRYWMLQRQRENESGMVGNFVEIASREAEGHLVARKILSIRSVGKRHMYDLEIRHPSHNFFIFNGIITSNSHAMAYSAITAAEFWLKFKFPTEYMTSLLRNTGNNEKKAGSENVLIDYIKYCRRKRMIMLNPTINTKIPTFDIIEDNKIRFGLDHIKMVANNAQRICDLAPYTDFEDFYNRINRTKVNKRVVANLIASGAFDEFGKRICIKAQVEKLQKSNSQLSAEDAEKAVDAAHINTGACRNAIAFEYYRLRKDKKEALPKEENSEHWWDKEKEIMGICLSRPPAFYTFKDIVDKNKWTRISDAPFKNDAYVFGRIEKATPKTSKSGNQMLVVELTDDVDTMNFYVFQNSRNQYQKELKVGYVAAIPLKKFDDSSTRYYDLRRSSTIVQKKASTQ